MPKVRKIYPPLQTIDPKWRYQLPDTATNAEKFDQLLILRDKLDFSYRECAEIIGKSHMTLKHWYDGYWQRGIKPRESAGRPRKGLQ
jgi:hypothetical protein